MPFAVEVPTGTGTGTRPRPWMPGPPSCSRPGGTRAGPTAPGAHRPGLTAAGVFATRSPSAGRGARVPGGRGSWSPSGRGPVRAGCRTAPGGSKSTPATVVTATAPRWRRARWASRADVVDAQRHDGRRDVPEPEDRRSTRRWRRRGTTAVARRPQHAAERHLLEDRGPEGMRTRPPTQSAGRRAARSSARRAPTGPSTSARATPAATTTATTTTALAPPHLAPAPRRRRVRPSSSARQTRCGGRASSRPTASARFRGTYRSSPSPRFATKLQATRPAESSVTKRIDRSRTVPRRARAVGPSSGGARTATPGVAGGPRPGVASGRRQEAGVDRQEFGSGLRDRWVRLARHLPRASTASPSGSPVASCCSKPAASGSTGSSRRCPC
jgi:hypothetical protein